MLKKITETSAPVHTVFSQRWSGVCFDPERTVPREILMSALEAARWAPSCFGDEPWRYLVCERASNPAAWDKAFGCLTEPNQAWCKYAPVLVVTCADTLFRRNGKPNAYHAYDTGAATVSLCLQAAAHGVMTHQMAGFSADHAQTAFAIPERFRPLAMMAMGYELPEDRFPPELRERELKPRQRRPLQEQFFAGEWDEGI